MINFNINAGCVRRTETMYKMSASALLKAKQAVLDDHDETVTTMDADMEFQFDETVSLGQSLDHISKPIRSYINMMVKALNLGFDNDERIGEDLEGIMLWEAYTNKEVTLEEDEEMWPDYLWPAAAPAADPTVNPAPAPPLSMTLVPVRVPIDYYKDAVSESWCSGGRSSGGPPEPMVIQLAPSHFNDFVYVFVFSLSH